MAAIMVAIALCAFIIVYPGYFQHGDSPYYEQCINIWRSVSDLPLADCFKYFEKNPDITAEELIEKHNEDLINKIKQHIET